MQQKPTQRTTRANRERQPHQLHVNQRHVHLFEIMYCEDTRPGQQLEASQRQHADHCKLISAKAVTLHTILLGVGGTCYTDHTLNQFKQRGLDHQRANELAQKLHAHSVQYANKLVTTRHAMENSNASHNQVLEPGASSNPPDPISLFFCVTSWWRRLTALPSQCDSFSLIGVGRVSSAYIVFLFFSSQFLAFS
eukprot:1156533-Pelagomonas_calceolata.AAC.3